MDPNATIATVRDTTLPIAERIEAALALFAWGRRGGFAPDGETWGRLYGELREVIGTTDETPAELLDPYTEVDPGPDSYTRDGEAIYSDPRIEFDEMSCARCNATIGPYMGINPYTGNDAYGWAACFDGPLGLVCADCADDLDNTTEAT